MLHDPQRRSKAPKKTVQREVLKHEALILRAGGASYDKIASHLGVSVPTAFRYVTSAFEEKRKECKEVGDQVVELELERLDGIFLAHWSKRGDNAHAATLLRVMDQRAKFLGTYAAERQEISGPGGGPIMVAEMDRTEELLARLGRSAIDTEAAEKVKIKAAEDADA